MDEEKRKYDEKLYKASQTTSTVAVGSLPFRKHKKHKPKINRKKSKK